MQIWYVTSTLFATKALCRVTICDGSPTKYDGGLAGSMMVLGPPVHDGCTVGLDVQTLMSWPASALASPLERIGTATLESQTWVM